MAMSNIRPPKHSPDHPDRPLDCEEAMSSAFRTLVEQAMAAGWREAEITISLADIAEEYVLAVAARQRKAKP